MNSDKCENMKTYKDSFIEMDVPQSYQIEYREHWDMGHCYFIRDQNRNLVLGINGGGQTFYGRTNPYEKNKRKSFDEYVKSSAEYFQVNAKIDTVEKYNGKIYKKKVIVLKAGKHVDGYPYLRPFYVEFNCFLDFIDSLTCENIVASAKPVH
jgi:hypothetical protein